ncbi:exodeoxyribonuclease V subunit alpha [Shewanella waksmanii]|uniref:exodeoxyribonuclease V subunit alpha n=1 Tax=Shewanella waksmanii TaxID=213783 RepID=UPI003734ECFE
MIQLQAPVEELLIQWQSERLITPLDRHFALQMRALHQDSDPLFEIICALLSRQLSQQHTCLPLAHIDRLNPFAEQRSQCQITADISELSAHLANYQAISRAQDNTKTPLILDGEFLYLQRYYQFELDVSHTLNRLALTPVAVENPSQLRTQLALLFPDNQQQYDWQKIATATAFNRQLAVITGGPGTGKTTTVTKLLFLLAQHQQINIKLVAPTGKAAARLSESIKASKARLMTELASFGHLFELDNISAVPEDASTLHRLLGVIPNSHRYRHHKDNPLRLDLLVIDEASMVDLPMMHKILQALPEHARLILLGDQDQLASVEAGAVLADICAGLKHQQFDQQGQASTYWQMRYSEQQAQYLSTVTETQLTHFTHPQPKLGDSLCMLMHSHRFKGDAGIGQLAGAVNQSDLASILAVWQRGYDELQWFEHTFNQDTNTGLNDIKTQAVTQYGQYLKQMAAAMDDISISVADIIDSYNRYRLLCAMRVGEYGVEGINQTISNALKQAGLIEPSQEFYAGRPVIIQSNDYNLGLFNGDIGLILADRDHQQQRLMAHFVQADGSLLKVLPARLPKHDTCFAMTVHKSQGSEFEQVALVLPPKPSVAQQTLLSKELIYTAITRAKQHFSCLGSQAVFERACLQATKRASGLAMRLW